MKKHLAHKRTKRKRIPKTWFSTNSLSSLLKLPRKTRKRNRREPQENPPLSSHLHVPSPRHFLVAKGISKWWWCGIYFLGCDSKIEQRPRNVFFPLYFKDLIRAGRCYLINRRDVSFRTEARNIFCKNESFTEHGAVKRCLKWQPRAITAEEIQLKWRSSYASTLNTKINTWIIKFSSAKTFMWNFRVVLWNFWVFSSTGAMRPSKITINGVGQVISIRDPSF